jgi:hypothetical protein
MYVLCVSRCNRAAKESSCRSLFSELAAADKKRVIAMGKGRKAAYKTSKAEIQML